VLRLLFEAAERKYHIDTRAATRWIGMMCDYESTEMSAVQEVAVQELLLPVFEIEGCHMHYCSAIIKHVKHVGLTTAYKIEDTGLRKFISQLFALAFAPPQMISAVYFEIKRQLDINMQACMIAFFQYYENQWIHNPNLNVEKWSVYNRVDSSYRTDNDLEGMHR
jgi:hypothetical protein